MARAVVRGISGVVDAMLAGRGLLVSRVAWRGQLGRLRVEHEAVRADLIQVREVSGRYGAAAQREHERDRCVFDHESLFSNRLSICCRLIDADNLA
jgi:hypothetical protein